MDTKRKTYIPGTASSGNVFADLGFVDPEEELHARSCLASGRGLVE